MPPDPVLRRKQRTIRRSALIAAVVERIVGHHREATDGDRTGGRAHGSRASPSDLYDETMVEPPDVDTWLLLTEDPLPVGAAADWVVQPDCGAVVVFSGTARDHAAGRKGVDQLEYEAYEEKVVARFDAIAGEIRARWPDVGRIALLHRVGVVNIAESSVVVAVSSPHRPAAFEAARFGIDSLKATAPIWKRERWADGESWGLDAQPVTKPGSVQAAP